MFINTYIELIILDTQFQLGHEPYNPASKTDWDRIWQLATTGEFDEIPSSVRLRHYTTLKKIRSDHQSTPPDLDGPCGLWIHGPPGVGKSRLARDIGPGAYMKAQNKWWDCYNNEEVVILDDLDSDCLGHYLKIWADRYAFVAEYKGGSFKIRPKKFIVTSNYRIDDLFKCPILIQAIKRRFTINHMSI